MSTSVLSLLTQLKEAQGQNTKKLQAYRRGTNQVKCEGGPTPNQARGDN